MTSPEDLRVPQEMTADLQAGDLVVAFVRDDRNWPWPWDVRIFRLNRPGQPLYWCQALEFTICMTRWTARRAARRLWNEHSQPAKEHWAAPPERWVP